MQCSLPPFFLFLPLLFLDRFPEVLLVLHLRNLASEDPWMAADHLLADAVHHIIHGKISLLRLDLTVEHDLEQDSPQLLAEIFRVMSIDRLQHLRAFLHEMLFQRVMILRPIPWTAILRTQCLHDLL